MGFVYVHGSEATRYVNMKPEFFYRQIPVSYLQTRHITTTLQHNSGAILVQFRYNFGTIPAQFRYYSIQDHTEILVSCPISTLSFVYRINKE